MDESTEPVTATCDNLLARLVKQTDNCSPQIVDAFLKTQMQTLVSTRADTLFRAVKAYDKLKNTIRNFSPDIVTLEDDGSGNMMEKNSWSPKHWGEKRSLKEKILRLQRAIDQALSANTEESWKSLSKLCDKG